MLLTVYVPGPNAHSTTILAPRSALVGDPERQIGGLIVCYYEGAVYGQNGLERFHARLVQAAGRLAGRYPTIAMRGFAPEDLTPAARYDAHRHVLTKVIDPDALEAWSGESVSDIAGIRLPAGATAWAEAAKLAQPPEARPIGRQGTGSSGRFWYRTQAGQLLVFEPTKQRATVYEHDDPALTEQLANLGLSDAERRLIFG